VIHLAPGQADALIDCFRDGFFVQKESVRTVFQPPHQFNILDEKSALKADFWQLRDNEFEQQMFARRQLVELFDMPAWIATAEDILLHKLYWNRKTPSERQLLDAAGVYAVQSDTLDLDYVSEWAEKLQVGTAWHDLRSGRLKPKNT
jgi:hypothetical protein